ncbi:MAG: GNAT family protein [Clostridium sp.]
MKKLNFRKAQTTDVRGIIDLLNEENIEADFAVAPFNNYELDEAILKEHITETHNNNLGVILVCEKDNEIIGILDFQRKTTKSMAHCGDFEILVKKEFTNSGVGKSIVSYFEAYIKDNTTVQKVNLKVPSDNERAIQMFRELGFLKEGIREKSIFRNGQYLDQILMGKVV